MNSFALPRAFAALSGLMFIAAIVVWPVAGIPYLSATLAVCGACLSFMSHDLSRKVRALHRTEQDQRRRAKRVGMDWQSIEPTRVSADPDVSLLARIRATPDKVA